MNSNNYARHRTTGEIVPLQDGLDARTLRKWLPKRPQDWAIWKPVERLRSVHRIGEDPDVYLLRQLEVSAVGREATMLRRRWKREGLSNDDRARVFELAKSFLKESFYVN